MPEPTRIHVAVNPTELALFFTDDTLQRLRALGDVTFAGASPRITIPDDVADEFDVLVTSWCTDAISAERLVGSRLRLGVHTAGSIKRLFPKSVIERGVHVVQAGSDAMAPPVAELALAMTLAILRNLHTHDRLLQSTRDWVAGGHQMMGNSIQAQRIGIVGLSRTGRQYLSMLRCLGVSQLRAYDPYVSEAEGARLGVEMVDLAELCSTSDVLAIHAPVTPETHHMIGAAELSLLPTGSVLINTARSVVVNEAALVHELVEGRIRAGLDVFDDEPLLGDSPLFGLPNVLLTPHVAAGTVESRYIMGTTVITEIERFLKGKPLQHEVHLQDYDRLS